MARRIQNSQVQQHALQLGAKWVRLNDVAWQAVQPVQGGPYNWSALAADFERNLLAAAQLGLRPVVVVRDSPTWATVNVPVPMPCGAIRADRFTDFAAFMSALVTRYSQPPYNVRHWELGNEPDVDPHLLPLNTPYGCWGNIWDPYYGGEHYGAMLKVVSPAIRAADPAARILVGGLWLPTYQSTDPGYGYPERFLEGILRAGAAPHFDIVPYHAHAEYNGARRDYSGEYGTWAAYGGIARGKPTFLREVMARYGVSKPLWLNETSLGCPEFHAHCLPPAANFYQAQADFVPRMMVRSLHAGAEQIVWFTLNEVNWRYCSLLDSTNAPRPAYKAYQTLIAQLGQAPLPPEPVTYDPYVEGYRFYTSANTVVDVLWTMAPGWSPVTVTLPQSSFIRATRQDGSLLSPTISDGNARLSVGFSAIYIHRLP